MEFYGSRPKSSRDLLSRFDETQSLVWALTQKPTAARCFEDKSGPPAWKGKPSWYQISANDRLIPTETEMWMAERIKSKKDNYVTNELRFRGDASRRDCGAH